MAEIFGDVIVIHCATSFVKIVHNLRYIYGECVFLLKYMMLDEII